MFDTCHPFLLLLKAEPFYGTPEWWDWYNDKYQHSREWRRYRQLRIEHAGYTCEHCRKHIEPVGESAHIHHLKYQTKNGKSVLGYERLRDTKALCPECHEAVHSHQQTELFQDLPRRAA